jgi:hypothetical protein
MSLIDHAKQELDFAGYNDGDEMNAMMRDNVLELIQTFANQGHSGFSANFCIQLFTTLAKYEPMGPLTGKPEEWAEVTDGLWQNKRCGRVFKESDGMAYDISGRVFEDEHGCWYTSRDSRVPVVFPYIPTTEEVRYTSVQV